MIKYPNELTAIISHLKKLPGVGAKTAERFAFTLLEWPDSELKQLGELFNTLKEKICHCPECGCLMVTAHCDFCDLSKRQDNILCVISTPRDVFAIEQTGNFKGLYHVIGGLLSPMEGKSIDHLQIDKLHKRIQRLNVQEVIIALDATLEGDATALYLKKKLNEWNIPTTRLALGLPMGSSLDFIDGSTLSRALTGRQSF